MNILLINQYYPPDTAPTGRYLHDWAKVLVQRGHRVTVICSQRAYNGQERYPLNEERDGVQIRRLRASGYGRRRGWGKLLDYASFYLNLAFRLFSSGCRPDVMVALTTPPHLGLLVAWAARCKGVAHVHWVMDVYPDVLAAHGALRSSSLLYRVLAGLTRHELRDSPLIVCLGEDMAARLRGYVPASRAACVVSVPLWSDPDLNPWDAASPPAFRGEQGWSRDEVVFMYSGNMGRGHRLGEFLAAAHQTAGDPLIRWVFAGGGKRREEVEAFARSHPDARLQVLPYAPADRLREHLCSADVQLASLDAAWQGCMVPSKIQGIFAVGKPVIFVGGKDNSLAQWIQDSDGGWVVAPDDLAGLQQAVQQARDAVRRNVCGTAARYFAERHFQQATNVGVMVRLLEQCGSPGKDVASSPRTS